VEFGAAKLAVGEDMPLMVIKSSANFSEDSVQYFHPCDTFKLQPFKGEFSVDSDRAAVNGTLGKMIAAKTKFYERPESYDPLMRRLVQCFTPVFVPRIDISDVASPDPADPDAPSGSFAPAATTAVERMKRFFGWRTEEEEAQWMEETRLNLLTLACTLDDEAAVDELLALPAEQRTRLLDDIVPKVEVSPGSKAALTTTGRTRSEPFGKLFCMHATGMTPLIAAATFSSTAVLKKVLAACEPRHVEREALGLLGDNMCTFRGCIMSGRVDNLQVILDAYPKFATASTHHGATPLMMATWITSGQNQSAMMKLLLERGAAETLGAQNMFGETVFMQLARIYDGDLEAIRLLLEAAGDRAAGLLTQPIKIPQKWKFGLLPLVMRLLSATGNLEMRGLRRHVLASRAEEGTTAVHRAAARGDVEMLKLFKEVANVHPASASLKSARRGTPLDVVNRASLGAKSDYYQTILDEEIGPVSPLRKAAVPNGRADQVLPHAGGGGPSVVEGEP